MIKVRITHKSIHICGHAQAAPMGEDLVCSAASMLLYTLGATLAEKELLFDMETESGRGFVIATDPQKAKPYLEMAATGLRMLAENFPQNVLVVV